MRTVEEIKDRMGKDEDEKVKDVFGMNEEEQDRIIGPTLRKFKKLAESKGKTGAAVVAMEDILGIHEYSAESLFKMIVLIYTILDMLLEDKILKAVVLK